MVVLDTNIIIDHLRAVGNKKTAFELIGETVPKNQLAVSILTVQELYEGQSTRIMEEEKFMLAAVTALEILPYSYETAQKAGELARDLGRVIESIDAAIAATAIVNGALLATLNAKDFQAIPELELYQTLRK